MFWCRLLENMFLDYVVTWIDNQELKMNVTTIYWFAHLQKKIKMNKFYNYFMED